MKAVCLLAPFLLTSIALAQAPMDDALWIAGRYSQDLTKVDRCGAVLQIVDLSGNGFNLRSVNRAPDGKLWVINYITPTLTITDKNGGNLLNISTSGTPYAVAFNMSGDAFVTMSNIGAVDRFDANGIPVTTYSVSSNPLGICIDNMGNAWVAHRVSPGVVSRIDTVSGAVLSFTLPNTSPIQPVDILSDYRPFGTGSHVWVIGDSSNDLFELDNAGNVLNQIPVGSSSSGLAGLAVDAGNHIWVTNYSSGEVTKFDNTTGAPVLSYFAPGAANDICIDSMGYPWIVSRTPTPAEVGRYDPVTGNFEIAAPAGTGSYNSPDAAGFHHAFVVDPTGDADLDGESNLLEIVNGTSPYDKQSTSMVSFNTAGRTQLGGQVDVLVSGTGATSPLAVLLAAKLGPPLPVGYAGTLYLDPLTIPPIAPIYFGIPSKLSVPIANSPTWVATIWMQGLYMSGPNLRLSNKAGIRFYP